MAELPGWWQIRRYAVSANRLKLFLFTLAKTQQTFY
jgi:hypothetical protein